MGLKFSFPPPFLRERKKKLFPIPCVFTVQRCSVLQYREGMYGLYATAGNLVVHRRRRRSGVVRENDEPSAPFWGRSRPHHCCCRRFRLRVNGVSVGIGSGGETFSDRAENKKGILSLLCGVECSISDKLVHHGVLHSFCLFTPLLRQSFCLFSPILRKSFCLYTSILRQSFASSRPKKLHMGDLKWPPHPNNNKKNNNIKQSLI